MADLAPFIDQLKARLPIEEVVSQKVKLQSKGNLFWDSKDGTNTYLIGSDDITLIDPGPNDAEHIEKILSLGGDKIKRILVTHTHKDHSPAALPISKKLNIDLIKVIVMLVIYNPILTILK